jgi:hypothetical protein
MRLGLSALFALLFFACPIVHAQDTEEEPAEEQAPASTEVPDPWLGCWSRTYDAAHLAKHSGQKVTALTLSIEKREPAGDKDPGKYLATITAKMRGAGDSYTNLSTGRAAARPTGSSVASPMASMSANSRSSLPPRT